MFRKIFTYLYLYLFIFSHFFSFFVYAEENNLQVENSENTSSGVIENSVDSETSSEGQGQTGSGESEENGVGDSELNLGGQEQTGSGEQEETGSGETNSFSGEVEENIFSSKVIFQNPSYILEKDEENREFYTCDENKEECKINFKFEGFLNSEELAQSKIKCETSFGFETGEENKCNPTTIIFPEGENEVNYKVILKSDETLFKEGSFIINNLEESGTGEVEEEIGSGELNDDSESSSEGQGTEESGSGEIEENTDFPIIYSFQRPTYFLEEEPDFGTGEIVYNCDRIKKECKLNLDFRPTFSGSLKERDFSCLLNFGSGVIAGEENKCNPNTVIIGTGKTEITYKIVNKDDENYYKTGSFFVLNEGYSNSELNSEGQNSGGDSEFQYIEENPKIGIQSGLSENLICDKKICSINLIYKKTNKKLACIWNFGDGDIGKTNTKTCNPGYVRFTSGKHKIKLKVYDKKNENNFKESFLEFENIYKIGELKARINLQGRLAKYKILKGNKLICNGVKTCSVNLTGDESTGEIKKYYWDFGNGETFEGKNPKSVKFETGKYEIKLKVLGENSKTSEASFFVEVLEEKIEIEEYNLDFLNFLDNYYKNLSFVKKEEFLRNKREELKKLFKLYHRKNKKFSTAYGKYKAYETILIKKKGKNFLGLFYNKEFLIGVSESSKFKQRLPYDMTGKFVLKSYILDKKLGVFSSGIEREFEVLEKDLENGEKLQKQISPLAPLLRGEGKEQIIIPKIELQGKIGKNKDLKDKKITCFGACSLNFDGRKSSGNFVEIVWDFGNGERGDRKNPKSVKYKTPGKYKVFLKLRDKFGEVYEDNFLVEVKKKIKKKRGKKKSKKIKYGPVKLKIEVQGKIGKNKILGENKIICLGTCSVNFDGRKSSGAYKKLTWDFGNGEIFSGENPKYIKYKKPGKYKVRLQATDYKGNKFEKEFLVDFKDEENFNTSVENIEKSNTGSQIENIFNSPEEKENKNGKYFILLIIVMILSGSFILLKRYKIL